MLSLIVRTLGWILNFAIALSTGYITLSDVLFVIWVFSAISKDLTASEKTRSNSSEISVSSFRISSQSMSFIFPSKEPLFLWKKFYYFPKSLITGYSRRIKNYQIIFLSLFYKACCNNFSGSGWRLRIH